MEDQIVNIAKTEKMASEEVESSVFLSPPFSEELTSKVISRKSKYDKIIPFNINEEENDVSKCDILTQSSKLNLVKVVISKILDGLSEKELLRYSSYLTLSLLWYWEF